MSRTFFVAPLAAMVLTSCGLGGAPAAPVPTDTVVRFDTVTITREVAPPLPLGEPTMICLANGQNVEVRVSEAGDTLVGPRRVPLSDLGPAIGFVGNYASSDGWFIEDTAITFDRRQFSKFGQPSARDCQSMKVVGDFNGVNLFADVSSAEPFGLLYVPVRPGVFQPYQAQVGRVRG